MAGAEANSVRLGRPARFASARVERLFLLQYRKSGVRFAKIAFLIAAGIAAAFIVLLEFWASAGQVSSPRQATRVGLLALLLLTALLLHYRPDIALRYFHACVGLPTLIASITLGAMSLVPVEGGTTGASRFVVAMSLACWLCFGFTRLPALLVLLGCGFASLLTIASSIVHGDDHAAAVAVYLVVANLIGWFMSNEIERRERSLFWKSRELMQTTRALERMAWEAREANAAKTRIMAMVCHDLRQPIGSLSLYLQLLRSNHLEAESDACMEPLRKAEACVDVLADNLTRMSEVSGLQRRRRRIELQHIDLRSVLERLELVHAVRAQCGATKLIVRVPAPGMLVARSDERRLWDVLSNLLANALKFGSSDRQPWVLIRGRRIGGAIEIYVRDNGIGIAPEHHERIFGE
ncbi:MAG: sensor histidine kinase, partial [Burkholderiaceae bacterium]